LERAREARGRRRHSRQCLCGRSLARALAGRTRAARAGVPLQLNGDTPQQAAAALGIRVSTARFHLAALFRKTDTRRQAELVRLLLSLPNT